jgi:hypothetical protein
MSQTESRLNYQIAKAARMDSYDMRAIALLTTFFLPGTFIAVRCPLSHHFPIPPGGPFPPPPPPPHSPHPTAWGDC